MWFFTEKKMFFDQFLILENIEEADPTNMKTRVLQYDN